MTKLSSNYHYIYREETYAKLQNFKHHLKQINKKYTIKLNLPNKIPNVISTPKFTIQDFHMNLKRNK